MNPLPPSEPPPPRRPTVAVERTGPAAWTWRIHHPSTGMTLLTGTAPTRRRARRTAEAQAAQWTQRYGHRHPRPATP